MPVVEQKSKLPYNYPKKQSNFFNQKPFSNKYVYS